MAQYIIERLNARSLMTSMIHETACSLRQELYDQSEVP